MFNERVATLTKLRTKTRTAAAIVFIFGVSLGFAAAGVYVVTRNDVKERQDVINYVKGKILLQVESHGEAWYVNPVDGKRYFMGRPADALTVMRALGLGITNQDLAKIPEQGENGWVPSDLWKVVRGRILLQVESHGEAWYVNPVDGKRYFMGRPADALTVMRTVGLGITDKDLASIPTATVSEYAEVQQANEPEKSSLPEVVPEPQAERQHAPRSIMQIPNVVILEIPENDPGRGSSGNVTMDALIKKYYAARPDTVDMLVTIDIGAYNGKNNGWSDGVMRRYLPSNIGYLDECSALLNATCGGYPARLRYIQQISMESPDVDNHAYNFIHELAHYWSIGWGTERRAECYDSWVPFVYGFSGGHWSMNFEAGERSALNHGILLQGKNGIFLDANRGKIVDNHNGTFTSIATDASSAASPRFNYVDLYAMGLISEEDLALKEMFTIYNLERKYTDPLAAGFNYSQPEWHTYYGERKNITLDHFKEMLRNKSECEGRNYFSGDGSRIKNSHDQGEELAKDFTVGLVLIKYPGQVISNKKAREICQAVNYAFPKTWHEATWRLSTVRTYLSEESKNPDCTVLFPISSD